jgi:hypothetical protein
MTLDVVGASEVAQILDVEVQRISRWREAGRMPPTVAVVKATPIWRWGDISRFRRLRNRWEGDAEVPQLDLVGLYEAAVILGSNGKPLDKSQIGRWRREGHFPAPVLDKRKPKTLWKRGAGLAATPIWMRQTIVDFASSRNGQ